MRRVLGESGALLIAVGIAVSALGFLSQSILTAPRVYFAMADDGLFFRAVAHVNRRTQVPDVAIVLQSVWTIVIAVSGTYERILNVIAMDFLFFGLTATTVFVFRRRERISGSRFELSPQSEIEGPAFRIPGHPITTALFVVASWLVVANTIYRYRTDSLIGAAVLTAGVPVYFLWKRQR
jgi:APA family basic amino acid/polyamine antiporter